jgi:antitoxin ParD1/3/4
MNVSLTKELAELVARRVASGRYGSASEVVRDALRLLDERDQMRGARLHELRREIGVGLRDLQQGKRAELDAATIKQAGRARASSAPKASVRRR